ncbi:Asp-tRNA(Asn)/Glu-tRNA(Gln) amidotransferase subunit GatC [Kerstersia gyiorum]|jgi:aspartyl-tRNA(Asn)/glutamyl-tRNA(Gln) amidotransferase subunit C|uniref:Aspartyl/glutamyl-tRNA(Asn/Gln) amidotransferase subunit C n=1 Tax=Kerstersia gyiorum TaxID=206506 RepID=A0A171KWE3_9BURK|nr:Asp-tRNA(Asn)/Glu-tRNA(Gln) amidotransferase subunit GatC [Kerstersia gyiorum]AZV94871.1 aspartyl/glutamyl-tRNA(Asn/Gln) amidotransferase subunit C [Bordetella sp. J329]MCO7635751.1 Asp-tRNA(Asn)/Glu-tRNA(Gln) amidotransferase subunit GatC [Pseudomonas sp. S 311-6]KAB0544996.1 Asp-tRNA(Asn)/Glu-tRNA(Gln) amidotransferase subunit GatC [Kerstersia gyiorum]KKO73210.1 glutamyl-tRNA amidotransferase [Kerstersia gyiorum]MCH4272075.1 Asp-tRNA(Asn)/Glu-tRNA(Gln) amidotransferase subunit GatC [Kerst
MALNQQDVARIARLARIALTPEQTARTQDELNRLLDIYTQLGQADTSGVEPLAHPLAVNGEVVARLREDAVTAAPATPAERDALMANAPAAADGLFLVPKVIE